LKKCRTTKLFWDKYLYKFVLSNSVGSIFRSKNLSYARKVLDNLQSQYESGDQLKIERFRRYDIIKESHFLDARKLYKFLSKYNDYTLRIERSVTSIYSNNREWLHTVKSALHKENLLEFWEPNIEDIKTLAQNIIIVENNNGYEYKVTLGSGTAPTSGFSNFAKTNPNLIRVGPVLMEELEHNGYVNNMYFYARDDRTLQLCNLMLDNIRRVDKLVTKPNLDK
jgi:hypothetical protein